MPKRLLFGAPPARLSSASPMPSSDRVNASSAAIRRAEERPEEPSASALSASSSVCDDRRTDDPRFLSFAYLVRTTLEARAQPLQLAPAPPRLAYNGASWRQTVRAATATVQGLLREDTMATTLEAETRPDQSPGLRVEDVEYQRQGGHALLARLYRPAGGVSSSVPYPAVVQIHGGAWVNKDRTDNDFIARAFAESGILVASIDFRMPPEAPYPASLADINLGARWLQARARLYGSRPDWVGSMGTSL